MKKYKSLVLLFCVAVCLTSCYDNQIYFDIENQSVITCNDRAIRRLSVDDVAGDYLYHFVKIEGKEGTNSFNLIDLNKNYKLEIMRQEQPLSGFNLKPNSEYKIRNSTYGDAASGYIKIETDDSGKITSASVTSCN